MGFIDNVVGVVRSAADKMGNIVGKARNFVTKAKDAAGKVRTVPYIGEAIANVWRNVPGTGYIEKGVDLFDKYGKRVQNFLSDVAGKKRKAQDQDVSPEDKASEQDASPDKES